MKEVRRQRFLELFKTRFGGDRSRLIEATRLTKGRIAQLFDERQPFGEEAARGLAERLGLPAGYFECDPPAVARRAEDPAAAARAEICAALSDQALALASAYDKDPEMRGRIKTALYVAGIGNVTETSPQFPADIHKADVVPTGGHGQPSAAPPGPGAEQYTDLKRLDDEVKEARRRGRSKKAGGGNG